MGTCTMGNGKSNGKACTSQSGSSTAEAEHNHTMCDHSHAAHGHSHADGVCHETEAEVMKLLNGAGPYGTKWSWRYDGGEFEVEFAQGGEFFCHDYPRHCHWTVSGDQLTIDWGDLGTYVMTVDPCCKSMKGCYKDYPEDWREATLIGELDHAHKHGDHHGHSHESGG